MFTNNFHLHKLKHQLHYTFRSKREIKSMKKRCRKVHPPSIYGFKGQSGPKKVWQKKKFQQKVPERGLTPPPLYVYSVIMIFLRTSFDLLCSLKYNQIVFTSETSKETHLVYKNSVFC